MYDIATYSNETVALLAEAPASLKQFDDEGNFVKLTIAKLDTIRLGAETISVVRCDESTARELAALAHLSIFAKVPMGEDVYAAMSASNKLTWDRIINGKARIYTDENGAALAAAIAPQISAFLS
ncbi:MAG: hypothetical protein AUK35_09620 [Zetaproteobacteria bacterium CG2_30_46_52]|nr:MAG: hypothetical protein AUK35_09620 [Zetaproteobacteria bacterium CG2_30_46_52]